MGRSRSRSRKRLKERIKPTTSAGAKGVALEPPTLAPNERYAIGPYRDQRRIPSAQRVGGRNLQAHHPIQQAWARRNIVGYDADEAITQYLETGKGEEHTRISAEQRKRRPPGGDWTQKSYSQARAEAVDQYRNAGLFEPGKQGSKAILEADAAFFGLSDETTVDPATGQRRVIKNARLADQMREAQALARGGRSAKQAAKAGRGARALSKLSKAGKHFVKAIPFIGTALSGASAAHAASEGDYVTASLDAAGNIPVAGDLLDLGRGGYALGESINEALDMERETDAHGARTEALAKRLGLGEQTARIVGASGAALSAITIAPAQALARKLRRWLR